MRAISKTGDVVLFCQNEFEHAVRPLVSGSKTIMRSDVLYKFESVESANMGMKDVKGGSAIGGEPPTGLTTPGPEPGSWDDW